MKILCIGDLHIKVDNIEQIDCAEKQIIDYLMTRPASQIEAVVILGDVLHTHERLHTLALNRAIRFFERLADYVIVYVLVGNHDYIQNDQFLTENHWMNGLKNTPNLVIVDTVLYHSSWQIVFLPYVPNGRFVEALNTVDYEWECAQCIFAHQEFAGANMRNGIISTTGDKWSDTLPLVISGHIHGRQTFSGVHYVGSTLPGLGAKTTAMTLVDLKTLELEEIPLIFSIKQTLSNVNAEQARAGTLNLDNVDRIVIQDTYDQFTLFTKSREYMDIVNRGIKISFKPIGSDHDNVTRVSNASFEDILYNTVLEKGDSFLYCALESIYTGTELNEADLLIVQL